MDYHIVSKSWLCTQLFGFPFHENVHDKSSMCMAFHLYYERLSDYFYFYSDKHSINMDVHFCGSPHDRISLKNVLILSRKSFHHNKKYLDKNKMFCIVLWFNTWVTIFTSSMDIYFVWRFLIHLYYSRIWLFTAQLPTFL